MQTTCYAIGASDYPTQMHFIVGGIEAVTGGGLILGPMLGSPLFASLGFKVTFCTAGGSLIFLAAVFACFFPNSQVKQDEEANDDYVSGDADEETVTIGMLFKEARFTMAGLGSMLCYF